MVIGKGTIVSNATKILNKVKIGEFSVIGTGVNILHNVRVDNNCIVGGGTTIGANVKIHNNVFVGVGATFASKKISAGQFASLAFNTLIVDALLSGEFCNIRRRVAHLLGMYGFVVFVATTAIMIFMYPTPDIPTPAIVSQLWHLGALMICIGGYWFWFFIRVDVAAEGNSPFRIVRADLFILSLLASATFGLVWSYLQANNNSWSGLAFSLHIVATTVLFGSVPWSKSVSYTHLTLPTNREV